MTSHENQIMIVDGYNVIGNWPELAKLKAEDHFDVARDRLLDVLAEYRSYEDRQIIVVLMRCTCLAWARALPSGISM